ncbi:hypothetical protein FVR03_12635 [Pontibacter qinzhouensis]|uniref:DUF3823 domain-containing protein n=1 Tax=Pontibacter qinzhouensis TaxID=2603253 RepID=A0A5C8K7K4_9BACT|nr:hypothetical protein [Pontibacter qinzhouensis]TXK45287.1 hypothetical protein FVR03_12635 [Pontibacter qinzhouensis]
MKYLFKYSATLVLLLVLFSSCRKEPVYDVVPNIEFKRVEKSTFDEFGLKRDRISIVVGFQDGDGNLGLTRTSDTTHADLRRPFNFGSPYYNNFITKLYIKRLQQNGESRFEEYIFPVQGFDFSGRFPRLSSDDRTEPLEGDIKYSFDITSDLFRIGDVIKLDVFIYDRTLPVPNRSNIVTTSEITLFQ